MHRHQRRYPQEYAEEFTKEHVELRGPDGVSKKTISHRVSMVNGRQVDVRVEEITKPDGTTEVTETINDGGNAKTNKYNLKDGMRSPAISA
jgi:hypothetical protein